MGRDHVGDRRAEGPQRGRDPLPLGQAAAGIAHRQREDLLPVPLGRQEGQGRRLPHHEPADELFGRGREKVAIEGEHVAGSVQGMNDHSREHFRPDRVQLELERGHYPEIPPAAPERPEQIRVVLAARPHHLTFRGDDLGREQVVDGEAEPATQPSEPAAQGQPGDSRRRIDAERRGEPERLGFAIEVGQGRPAPDSGGPRVGIDLHRFHRRQVDHEPALADGIARDVVAAAAHGQEQIVVPRKAHRQRDVGRAGTAGDQRRAAIDHGVPDGAGLVVARCARREQSAEQPRF